MPKVLIAEDSILISGAIKILLEQDNIQVEQVTTGDKVLDATTSGDVKLIILDLNMPGMKGEEVFKALKENEATKDIKILILTAKADALKWNEELKDCDKFMSKPFDNNELLSEVKRLLKE